MITSKYSRYCLITLTTLAITACGGEANQTSAPAEIVRPVKLVNISAAQGTEITRFPAVVSASQSSELSFQVGGLLQEFPIKEAQTIQRGELIAKLDPRDFQSVLDAAKAQFNSANTEYQRAERLAKEDAIASSVLEQRKTQLDIAKSQLDQAEKALDDSVLTAPFNGVIAQKHASKRQTISPGQDIVKLINVDLLEAQIDLPASFIANIPKDEASNDQRRAYIMLDSAPDQMIEATFKEASLLADTSSQTYEITFEFTPPSNLLVLPGMNATVEIQTSSTGDNARVAIPMSAVTGNDEEKFVWVVDKSTMLVSKRAVALENGVGETLIVTDGLSQDDTIVAAGAAYLSEGLKVREWK
ncbi:efflux RND transporter periplasmic adaptor subunit [Halioxenophilus aromaticivorans]